MFGTNYIFILHSFKSVYDILHRFCLFILHSCSMWLSSLHCILTSRPHIGLARFCGCIHWSTWNSSVWCSGTGILAEIFIICRCSMAPNPGHDLFGECTVQL